MNISDYVEQIKENYYYKELCNLGYEVIFKIINNSMYPELNEFQVKIRKNFVSVYTIQKISVVEHFGVSKIINMSRVCKEKHLIKTRQA